MTEYPTIDWVCKDTDAGILLNSADRLKLATELRTLLAERDALAAKAPMERKLREYKGVTYRGGSWHYRDTSAFMASALISGYCDTFTDADHAAIYALRDDPYEPVETVNDILVDFARDLSTGRVVFHDTFVTRIRAAVAAEKAQGEG